jgi:hypothetical protein
MDVVVVDLGWAVGNVAVDTVRYVVGDIIWPRCPCMPPQCESTLDALAYICRDIL